MTCSGLREPKESLITRINREERLKSGKSAFIEGDWHKQKPQFYYSHIIGQNFLLIIAAVSLGLSFALPYFGKNRAKNTLEEATTYAISEFGDYQPPLTFLEKATWYESMGIKEDKKPEVKTLQNYIDDCINRKIIPYKKN